MKKRFLLIPAVTLPLLAAIPAISSYANVLNNKSTYNNANNIVQVPENNVQNYSVDIPTWTHYAVGEKLDLRDLRVTLYDTLDEEFDVTDRCTISMQNGEVLNQEGEFDISIKHDNFNYSFKIYVEKEPHEVRTEEPYEKCGAITVEFKLMSNQECVLTGRKCGIGTLEIPDYIERDGVKYFIKEIPSDWSDGENYITGLKFDTYCKHLKKICDSAFEGTNCLDYYIHNKDQLLEFPEGLEEIGEYAFFGTDWGQHSIKGYSFPSTLKKIGKKAFFKAPYINGDDDNGELWFKSVPENLGTNDIFHCYEEHKCKYIYAPTQEMAEEIVNMLKLDFTNFTVCGDYLIPCTIEKTWVKQFTWGDITVECNLTGDECTLIDYISGSGTLVMPDYVEHGGVKYFIKQIPHDWSDGENDITGLKFECKHLRKICDHAFEGTNCLDNYINDKSKPLQFPEGLEEIGEYAFSGTDWGQHSIKGYSFPSTLKKIGEQAFGDHAPYIDGDNDNGVLEFRSIPEIDPDAFYILGAPSHDCKFISAKTQEMANQIVQIIKDNMSDDFNTGSDYLIPKVIEE